MPDLVATTATMSAAAEVAGRTATVTLVAGTAPMPTTAQPFMTVVARGSVKTTGITTVTGSPGLVTALTNGKRYRAAIQAFGPDGDGPWTTFSADQIVGAPVVFSAHPADASVAAGSSVSFTATSGGSTPITYQWEQQFLDGTIAAIAGETGASYTIASAPAEISGRKYRRADTNVRGTVRSNWATLTVTAASQYGPQPFDGTSVPAEFAVLGSAGGGNASIVNGRMRVDAVTAGYGGSVLLGLTRGGVVPNFGGNFEVTTKVLRNATDGQEMYSGFHARRRTANNNRLTFEWVGDIHVYAVDAAGASVEIGRFTFGYPTVDYWLKVRVKDEVINGVDATSVQVKFWPVGSASGEPAYGAPLRTTAVPALGADYDLAIFQASGSATAGWSEYDDLVVTGA